MLNSYSVLRGAVSVSLTQENTVISITLHTPNGDVTTTYHYNMQMHLAKSLIDSYIADRKKFTVSYE